MSHIQKGEKSPRTRRLEGPAPAFLARRRSFLRARLASLAVAFLFIATSSLVLALGAAGDSDDDDDDDDDDAPTFTVDDPPKADCPLAQFTTIQAAVAAAALMSGAQSIRVCPGTYPENVVIGAGNSVVIRGSGTGNTLVTGVPGTSPGPIFDVAAAGSVSISRLTVDGLSAMEGGVVWGIRYDDTDGTIQNVVVKNIRDATGASQGLCIRIQTTAGTSEVNVRHTTTDNCTRVNIIANGAGVEAVIEKNKLTGPVTPKVWAPNGVQVSRGAEARVTNNKVSGMTSPNPPGGAGSGIILFCAGPTKVRHNYVSSSDLGIALADNADATVSQNRVENSVFDAYSLQFIGTIFGPLGCPSFPSPTEHNILRDNRARNSGEYGLSFANFDPSNPNPPSENTISKNDIRGSGIDGIAVFDGTDNTFLKNRVRDSVSDGIHVVDGADNLFRENRIRGSGNFDAHDETTGSGTEGTANTWDDNECDTSNPPGLCDEDEDDDDSNSFGTRSGSVVLQSGGESIDWHSFGTEQNAKDPKDPNNDVALIDTTDPDNDFGAVTRDLDAKVADLTGLLSVDYYIEAKEVDLPFGGHLVINRGCGGGPPRYELAIDLDGDGSFDGNAVGYIGPAPTFTGCAQNAWQHQDLTDDGLRWNLLELGGLPLNTWAGVLAFFEAHPGHKVQGGTLVDDAGWLPIWAGLDYFDNIEIGDETMTHGL